MNNVLVILFLIAQFFIVHCQFNESLTNWIVAENTTALARIFDNIGSQGIFALDGDPGSIVASPSTAYPNYYFQISPILLADIYWVRDTALTYQYLTRLYEGGNSSLETLFFDYVNETRKLQNVESWGGGFHNGGIGEPKCRAPVHDELISRFYLNGTPYLE
jgi:glucoamylase